MRAINRYPQVDRRRFLCLLGGGLTVGAANLLMSKSVFAAGNKDYKALVEEILPSTGYQTSIFFGDSIKTLVESGAIDPDKFETLYEKRGGLPAWVKSLFSTPSTEPILLNAERAPLLLNLLWPLGIANQTKFNEKSPLLGDGLAKFASIGGWVLSKEGTGTPYFNKVTAVSLTSEEEETVYGMATNIYRPCCDKNTFYQDCNHGSALLGLLQLGASQGIKQEELYRTAWAANAYWYRKNYILTSIYFEELKGTPWNEVSPETMLSKEYSSLPAWNQNVEAPLRRAGVLDRLKQNGVSCGV